MIFHSELSLIWCHLCPRSTKGSSGKSRKVWVWLSTIDHIEPKLLVTDVTFPWWLLILSRDIWWLKNSVIWLVKNIFPCNLQTKTDMQFLQKYIATLILLFYTNFSQISWHNSTKMFPNPIFGSFLTIFADLWLGKYFKKKNILSHKMPHKPLTSCNAQIPIKVPDRWSNKPATPNSKDAAPHSQESKLALTCY